MTVEELIAKLGFKVTGLNEATKFVRELERIKKAAAGAGKGIKLNFTGNTSGLSRIARDFDRASASARKFEQIARRAGRVNFNGRGPSFPGGTRYPGPGGIPGGQGGRKNTGKGQEKWGLSDIVDGLVSVAAVVTGVKALKTFGNLEEAITELGITAGKTAEEMQPALETFRVEAPKLGITAQNMAELAGGFVAAGIDYDTAVKAAVSTAKAGKASYTDLEAATSASIAVIQNLGVKIGDLGKAQDMMIAGGKLGRAEFKEMAGVMPMLASSGAKLGLKDLKGVRDITAMLEVVREGSATTGDAAIHLKDFMEKLSDPVTVKYLKKHAGVDWEKEMKDADKKGQSRPDRALQIIAKYTKGDSFRLGEIMHEQQSRDAANQLLRNLDKYEDFKKQIDSGSAGTTDRDLATVLGTLNNSMDRLSTSFDNFQGRLGQIMSGGAKAGLAISEGAVTGATGEGQTGAERNATVEKLNRMWGAPPNLSGVFGSYGRGVTQAEFEKRFGAGTIRDRLINPGTLGGRMRWKANAPGAVSQNSFGLNGGIGQGGANAEWMKQAVQQTTNTTNNTNTGNDQRTQSVTIQQTVNGVPGVASAAAEGTQRGLASMGASVVKGNLTSTGATTSP